MKALSDGISEVDELHILLSNVTHYSRCCNIYIFVWFQIDYPDVQIMRPGSRSSHNSGMNNIDKILALDHEDVKMGRGRYHSDSSTEQVRFIQNTSSICERIIYVCMLCNVVLKI